MNNNELLETAKDIISDFVLDNEECRPWISEFENLSEVKIIDTTIRDTEIPLIVSVDLNEFSIIGSSYDIVTYQKDYDSLEELVEALKSLKYDELIAVSNKQFEEIKQNCAKEICINEGWDVTMIDNKITCIETTSPQGYDFVIEFDCNSADEVLEEVHFYFENYDISSEAYLWLDNEGHGKNGAPHNMIDVYNDFAWCENKVYELEIALRNLLEA